LHDCRFTLKSNLDRKGNLKGQGVENVGSEKADLILLVTYILSLMFYTHTYFDVRFIYITTVLLQKPLSTHQCAVGLYLFAILLHVFTGD